LFGDIIFLPLYKETFGFNIYEYVPAIVQDDAVNFKPIQECLQYQLARYKITFGVCVNLTVLEPLTIVYPGRVLWWNRKYNELIRLSKDFLSLSIRVQPQILMRYVRLYSHVPVCYC